jgi:hypothetical protein
MRSDAVGEFDTYAIRRLSAGAVGRRGEFGRKMDSPLTLLDSTANALEAEWDLRSEGADLAGSPKATIQ